MCGFAGVVTWDEKYRVRRDTLEKMSRAIAHRGPDGQGYHLTRENEPIRPDTPQVALAFRRLAIIDPDPRSNQPFHIGPLTLVFNGEIYNFRELKSEISNLRPEYRWRTTGDTEVLLMAYSVWGSSCFQQLTGMFAAAVWEERTQELVIARDRRGQKPLFFSDGDGWVAFASEIAALLSIPWIAREVRADELEHYLRLGYCSQDNTLYEQVKKVRPAWFHVFKADPNEREAVGYEIVHLPRPGPLRDGAAVERTRDLVTKAVAQQLVSDVPLGCFLSGGADSSVIAVAMKRALREGAAVQTFSIGFDDPRYDETRYAQHVASMLGTRHHTFIVRPDAAADLPKLAPVFGEPFGDSSALPVHYLSRETRKHVKVALSGDGGDELFGGYDRYRAVRYSRWVSFMPRALRRAMAQPLAQLLKSGHPKTRSKRLSRFLWSLERSPGERYASYVELFGSEQLSQLLGHEPRPDPISGWFNGLLRHMSAVEAARNVDRVLYLPEDLLAKVDRCSMLHGLEVRSPFMDHELVQFAAGLTTEQLLKGGPKRMLREAFAKDLPDFVFKRKKMGFAVPIGQWFRGELRPMLRDNLFASDSFARAHFNVSVVQRLVDEHEANRVDHSERLYALLMLELWWRWHRSW